MKIYLKNIYPNLLKENENIKEVILFSNGSNFPLKIKFVDKDDRITDYILFKTRKEKLILQKPFLNNNDVQR